MERKKFNKLLKELEPQKIINQHCNLKISLTDKQIEQCIAKRDKNKCLRSAS